MSISQIQKNFKLHDWFQSYANVNWGFVKWVNFNRVLYPHLDLHLAMQVPKLRDLKSHSFPQTWGEEDCSPPLCSGQSADEKRRRWVHCQGYTEHDRWVREQCTMSVFSAIRSLTDSLDMSASLMV